MRTDRCSLEAGSSIPTQTRRPFGHKDRTRSSRFHGFAATLSEFVDELFMAGGYVLPLLVVDRILFATQSRRNELRSSSCCSQSSLQLAFTFVVAWRNGYLSTRHFAVPIVLTLPYAARDWMRVAARIAKAASCQFTIPNSPFQTAIVGGFVFASLIATERPLHESQIAHRQAAEWLHDRGRPGDVLDQQGFTALTSGRTTYRFDAAEAAFADPGLAYVVVERGDLEADSPARAMRSAPCSAPPRGRRLRLLRPHNRAERDVLVFARSRLNLALQENLRCAITFEPLWRRRRRRSPVAGRSMSSARSSLPGQEAIGDLAAAVSRARVRRLRHARRAGRRSGRRPCAAHAGRRVGADDRLRRNAGALLRGARGGRRDAAGAGAGRHAADQHAVSISHLTATPTTTGG